MSELLLELAADALRPLLDEVTFVGAATLAVWVNDESVEPLRITEDADVVIEVTTKAEYDRFSTRLRELNMCEDTSSDVICRWRVKESDIVIDVMPSHQSILGFEGEWLRLVPANSTKHVLPSGTTIKVARAPYLLAMKLEAFNQRGNGDYFSSKDFEDIVTLVSGREELIEEFIQSDAKVRKYVAGEFAMRIDDPQFQIGVEGQVNTAPKLERVEAVILPRLRAMIDAG